MFMIYSCSFRMLTFVTPLGRLWIQGQRLVADTAVNVRDVFTGDHWLNIMVLNEDSYFGPVKVIDFIIILLCVIKSQ